MHMEYESSNVRYIMRQNGSGSIYGKIYKKHTFRHFRKIKKRKTLTVLHL